MPVSFRVLTTLAFERQARKAVRGKHALASVLEKLIPILCDDPHNATGKYKIKKLAGVDAGDGQWRIRFGDYRLQKPCTKAMFRRGVSLLHGTSPSAMEEIPAICTNRCWTVRSPSGKSGIPTRPIFACRKSIWDSAARHLVKAGIALCAMLRDGRTYWSSGPKIGSGTTRVKMEEPHATVTFNMERDPGCEVALTMRTALAGCSLWPASTQQPGVMAPVQFGTRHRAVGVLEGEESIWFWIGSHQEYEQCP